MLLQGGTECILLIVNTHWLNEILMVVTTFCLIFRSDCGRQALLALGYFPEVLLNILLRPYIIIMQKHINISVSYLRCIWIGRPLIWGCCKYFVDKLLEWNF